MKKTRKNSNVTWCGRKFRDMEALLREINRITALHFKMLKVMGLDGRLSKKRK